MLEVGMRVVHPPTGHRGVVLAVDKGDVKIKWENQSITWIESEKLKPV